MLTRRLLMILILTGVALFATCRPSIETEKARRMDQIVRFVADKKEFMGSVLVAQGDHVVFSKGYGSANLEMFPNSPNTKFRIGSITKQFTAAAILLLEEQGKLKVDDLLRSYIKDAPGAWDKVTIRHLLTHTSGIRSFTQLPDFLTWRLSESSVEKTIGRFRDLPLEFPPGGKHSYSNSGYILLSYVVELVSGQKFEIFLQEKIFTPLGMKDSGYDSNTALIVRRAAGYTMGPDGLRNADYFSTTFSQGAGGLYSTTEDLLRWTQGLFGGKLLSASSLEKMITPFKDGYAFGLGVVEEHGHKIILHGGGIDGFTTQLSYFPDKEMTIAVLSNLNDNGDSVGWIWKKLAAVMYDEKVVLPSERTEINLLQDSLTKFTGAYELAPSTNLLITLEDDHLMAQIAPEPPKRLLAESATMFFARDVDSQVEFAQDTSGAVTALIFHSDGEDHRAPRVAERKEVKLSEQVLRAYTGTYELQPDAALVITLEGGRLMAQPAGQTKVEIYPEAEDKFFMKVAEVQLGFTRNATGRVTGLTWYQGGKEMKAARQ